MILGFHLPFGAFDAEREQILAQPRERPFVEKAGEIIRAIRKQLAAPDSNEEIEKLTFDLFGAQIICGLRQSHMRESRAVSYHREAWRYG